MSLDPDLAERLIQRYSKQARYLEIRIEISQMRDLKFQQRKLDEVSIGYESGAGIRALNSCMGFWCTNSDLESGISNAIKLSKLSSARIELSQEQPIQDWYEHPAKLEDLDQGRELILDCYNSVKHLPELNQINIQYQDGIITKYFISSEGSFICSKYPWIMLKFELSSRRGSLLQQMTERIGGVAGYELIKNQDPIQIIQSLAKRVRELIYAPRLHPRRSDVVLDPKSAGVFFHETLMHAIEADNVLDFGSVLSDKLGAQIAPEFLNLRDDPTIPNSAGFCKYDDEGVQARSKPILSNGFLVCFLQSRQTGAEFGARSTGNARASSYSHPPLVRMTNLVIQPGDLSQEELLEGSGIYAIGIRGGEVDVTTGNFQFASEEAYEFRNSELMGKYRGISISGNLLEVLPKIQGLGRELGSSLGFCEKDGQLVPVTMYSPWIRIADVALG